MQTQTNHFRLLSRAKRMNTLTRANMFQKLFGFPTIIYLYAPNRNRIRRRIRISQAREKYGALLANDNTFCYKSALIQNYQHTQTTTIEK